MERMVHGPTGVIAHELGQVTPGGADSFFFGNSRSEAVDAALKLARYVTGRPGIIGMASIPAFLGSFHGRTLGATSITSSKVKYRSGHGPLLPDTTFVRFPYPYRAEAPAEGDRVCAGASAEESLGDIYRLFEVVVPPEDAAG